MALTVTEDILLSLPPERLVKAVQISEFMPGDARRIANPNDTPAALSNRLLDAGSPPDRAASIVGLLHAENAASARVWKSRPGVRSFTFPFRP